MEKTSADRQMSWGCISTYRSELFGLSMLSIILFHYCEDVLGMKLAGPAVTWMAGVYTALFGSIGVDIFVFLSGMGLYFSIQRDPDRKLVDFYRRRLERILIPYLLAGGIFWLLQDLILLHGTVRMFLEDMFFVSMFTQGRRTIWFVGFLLVMYLLFPLIYQLIHGGEESKKRLLVAVLAAVWLAGMILLAKAAPGLYLNIEIALWRIPLFILGVYLGEKIFRKTSFSALDVATLSGCLLVKLAWLLLRSRGVSFVRSTKCVRASAALFSLFLIVLLVWLLKKMIRTPGNNILSRIGGLSLELYITHVAIRRLMNTAGLKTAHWYWYMVCIVVSLALSIGFQRITAWISSFTYRKAD